MSAQKLASDFEEQLLSSQVKAVESMFAQYVKTPGLTAQDIIDWLSRPALKPLLDRVQVNLNGTRRSAVAQAPISPVKKKRGRPRKVQSETVVASPVKKKRGRPRKSVIPDSNQATVSQGAKRQRTTFTAEQRDAQRKLIYQTVASNEKTITTPQIIRTVIENYPQIGSPVVRDLVKELVKSKHLRALQRNGGKTKAIHYAIGPQPF